MRDNGVRPTGIERTFEPHETIVSKTDPQGRLTYVNDVFLRVSGYAEGELLGRPHNVIRHPDMPRSVFKLLWDSLAQRREVFAYVVNLSADGSHYWVFAHVTPSLRGGRVVGYHSNRRVPRPGAIAAVKPLYARLRAEEARHPRPADGLAASAALLDEHVAGTGYDSFVWSVAA
jgi:PAS domain S-box-containing protein